MCARGGRRGPSEAAALVPGGGRPRAPAVIACPTGPTRPWRPSMEGACARFAPRPAVVSHLGHIAARNGAADQGRGGLPSGDAVRRQLGRQHFSKLEAKHTLQFAMASTTWRSDLKPCWTMSVMAWTWAEIQRRVEKTFPRSFSPNSEEDPSTRGDHDQRARLIPAESRREGSESAPVHRWPVQRSRSARAGRR